MVAKEADDHDLYSNDNDDGGIFRDSETAPDDDVDDNDHDHDYNCCDSCSDHNYKFLHETTRTCPQEGRGDGRERGDKGGSSR